MGSVGDDLKKDLRNIVKHAKKAISGFFKGKNRVNDDDERGSCCNNGSCGYGGGRPPFGGFPPFCRPRSPWLILFYPKCVVGGLLILTLLFCGVSLYGLIIIILLAVLLILI